MSVYRPILKQAWQISWKNPGLWIFGILAAVLTDFGRAGIILDRLYNLPGTGVQMVEAMKAKTFHPGFIIKQLANVAATDPLSLMLATLIFVVLGAIGLFFLWIAVKSQIGLIFSVKKITEKQKVTVSEGFAAGRKYFWPVLAINVLTWLAIWGLMAILAPLSIYLAESNDLAKLGLYVLLFTVYFLINISLYFVGLYAVNFRVLKSKPFNESISLAFGLFKDNWLASLEMAIILFAANAAGLLALVAASLVLAVPFYLLMLIFTFLGAKLAIFCLLFIMMSLMLVATGLFTAWITTFQMAAWTGLFLKLSGGGVISKLMRMAGAK